MSLSTLSWNLAAVNNNPFEYFLTHPDPQYAKLMEGVERFIEAPGDKDVPVSAVFTKDMYDDLMARMKKQGWDCAPVAAVWDSDLSKRSIVAGFLKDKGLGAKRLMSMPDRFTNTIDLAGGGLANRPCLTSNYDGDMGTLPKWWAAWAAFMFETPLEVAAKKGGSQRKRPCELLGPIPRAKYPALSEAEEAMSVPLQALCLALFDAVLLHIVCTVLPGGEWLPIKRSIIAALLLQKEKRTLAILTGPYAGTDVLFLQEARSAFTPSLSAALGGGYKVVAPATPSKADQNSLVVLRTAAFDAASVADVTAEAMGALSEAGKGKVASGDLLVVTATAKSGRKYVLASFHGDTDGLATLPVLDAVHAVATARPDHLLLFGLDANVYFKPNGDKQQGLAGFCAHYLSQGYTSSWGDAPGEEAGPTAYCARTYLQPQLQKATKAADKASKGDCNLKDFVLFPKASLRCVGATKDNTGGHGYLPDTCLPTIDFPSDHALITAKLAEPTSAPSPRLLMAVAAAGVAIALAWYVARAQSR